MYLLPNYVSEIEIHLKLKLKLIFHQYVAREGVGYCQLKILEKVKKANDSE